MTDKLDDAALDALQTALHQASITGIDLPSDAERAIAALRRERDALREALRKARGEDFPNGCTVDGMYGIHYTVASAPTKEPTK